jgi:hypothetical protein
MKPFRKQSNTNKTVLGHCTLRVMLHVSEAHSSNKRAETHQDMIDNVVHLWRLKAFSVEHLHLSGKLRCIAPSDINTHRPPNHRASGPVHHLLAFFLSANRCFNI